MQWIFFIKKSKHGLSKHGLINYRLIRDTFRDELRGTLFDKKETNKLGLLIFPKMLLTSNLLFL